MNRSSTEPRRLRRWGLRLATVTALGLSATLTSAAQARDLSGRVGAGISLDMAGRSALTARYWAKEDVSLDADLAISIINPDNGDSSSTVLAGFGGGYVLAGEENMNISLTGKIFGGTIAAAGNSETAFGLRGAMEAEFFLQGLPNLGLNASAGLTYLFVDDAASTFALGTGGFGQLGMRYYFGGGGTRPAPSSSDSPYGGW